MSFRVNRRRLLQMASSAIAIGSLPLCVGKAAGQSAGQLKAVVGGGAFGRAVIEAFVKPFEAESGIKVTVITDDMSGTQIAAMVASKNVTVDTAVRNQSSALELSRAGLLEPIDYSIFRKEELANIADYCKKPFGFGPYVYSWNLVFNTKKLASGQPRPNSWADFWDVKKFPGIRALATGQYGAAGPWEEALLADGVPADKLYPLDIDRAFASLDKIKPHIRKWWTSGAEILQIMQREAADIAQSYDGRALALIDQGKPIEIVRNQAKLTWDYWLILKGSRNVANAQRFLEFTSRADRQAAFAQLWPQAPSNSAAYKLIPDQTARKLATHPDYIGNSIILNAAWYGEVGPDGQSNVQRLVQRWNEWILR
ncbi:ABC transporter substrate-binding protein [Bradyrhizobium zhanjiangense]|uniref:ABC transporter n=1 Tax=Bradyrhizobium zhanjiangense TaxID=1325107 RepID=A0A4Q0SSP3_9BRAD|nr:ABC transporter substrate-binding protein [Bradyrhizobium zhanjiangense]RXH41748.1 ABC transporter [Bradyrhizobium zhanjiangense]